MRVLLIWFTIATGLSLGQEGAREAVLFFPDGSTRQGEVVSFDEEGIEIRLSGFSQGSAGFPYERLAGIQFPPTPEWREAMERFEEEDYAEAARQFERIRRQRTKRNYYPAPGNFATLGDLRLFDCYRRMLDLGAVTGVVERLEWGKLPANEREGEAKARLWSLAGQQRWDAVLEEAGRLRSEGDPLRDGGLAEASLLRGLALEAKGEAGQALVAFGEASAIYPASNREIAAEAIKHAAEILRDRPAREQELKGLVHLYAASFGGGELWEGAGAALQALLEEPVVELEESETETE